MPIPHGDRYKAAFRLLYTYAIHTHPEHNMGEHSTREHNTALRRGSARAMHTLEAWPGNSNKCLLNTYLNSMDTHFLVGTSILAVRLGPSSGQRALALILAWDPTALTAYPSFPRISSRRQALPAVLRRG